MNRRHFLAGLAALPLVNQLPHQQKLAGQLAYLKNGAAYWTDLATGKEELVPGSQGAVAVNIHGGVIVFFVPLGGRKSLDTPCLEFRYRIADKQPPESVKGRLFDIAHWTSRTPRSRTEHPLGIDAGLNLTVLLENGAVTLLKNYAPLGEYEDDHVPFFFPGQPGALLDALRRAGGAFAQLASEGMSRSVLENWSVGGVALTRPGKTLLFATNVGTGRDVFALFAGDIETGRIRVLTQAGIFQGKVPQCFSLTSKDEYLLFLYRKTDLSRPTPSSVCLLDMNTERPRELIQLPEAPNSNRKPGIATDICWSPDEHFVAIGFLTSGTAQTDDVSRPMGTPSEAGDTHIFDIATGQCVQTVPGACRPAWSKATWS